MPGFEKIHLNVIYIIVEVHIFGCCFVFFFLHNVSLVFLFIWAEHQWKNKCEIKHKYDWMSEKYYVQLQGVFVAT